MLDRLSAWMLRVIGRLHDLHEVGDDDPERGDVPGWVMVTVMSAILVVALLGVFEPQIKHAVGNAISSVTHSK